MSKAINESPSEARFAHGFTQFAEAAVTVTDTDSFKTLVERHVQAMLPHGMLLAVIGQLSFDHITAQQHIAINYPEWAVELVTRPIHLRERPVLQRWLHTRAPILMDPRLDNTAMSDRERSEVAAIGLGRFAVCGLPDLTSRMGSYFSFARIPDAITNVTLLRRLAIMTPLLHVALAQACKEQPKASGRNNNLTHIEQELLTWLAAGRTNQEIAAMRQRSPATIRNQLIKLYAKLGVASRAEAVSLSLSNSLNIPLPK